MDIEEAADGGRNATLCDNLGRWDGVGGGGREVGEGGDICISMADPCCCMTETNTILQSNYPSIKKKKRRVSRRVQQAALPRSGFVLEEMATMAIFKISSYLMLQINFSGHLTEKKNVEKQGFLLETHDSNFYFTLTIFF